MGKTITHTHTHTDSHTHTHSLPGREGNPVLFLEEDLPLLSVGGRIQGTAFLP